MNMLLTCILYRDTGSGCDWNGLQAQCMVMPIYVLVMQAVCLQCMLGPRAFTGRHVE